MVAPINKLGSLNLDSLALILPLGIKQTFNQGGMIKVKT